MADLSHNTGQKAYTRQANSYSKVKFPSIYSILILKYMLLCIFVFV